MGKSARKKKSQIDFDSLFDSTKPQSDGDGVWHTGVSAMDVMDAGETEPAAAAAVAADAAEPAAAAMDTADFVPLNGGKKKKAKGRQQGLAMQQQSLKISKRGNRTTAQKKRKAGKLEKGLAHAEKTEDRAGKLLKRKQAVAGLKTLY
ncbi:hypothetical protein OEZ85_004348 [Tetradesmus obliquus]|uniref:Uncharacterized protein n=1 Tax=Tetradesmus obliquus TaxID=3088 RepID=A0ABY8ULV5_TETOB|nr:hypothetical protein OEZ85_004348 [Tetradesmus obliquus]